MNQSNDVSHRKGQMTLFVIFGIFLLLTFVLLLLFKGIGPTQDFESVEDVPHELLSLQQFVDGCVDRTAKAGLILGGEHGGYIDPAAFGIRSSSQATDGSGVEFFPGYVIPYWWHLESINDCTECRFSTALIPVLYSDGSGESIEEQLESYVATTLPLCVGDFSEFSAQGFTIVDGEIDVDVSIRPEEVNVRVVYPLVVTSEDRESRLSVFRSVMAVALPKIYDAAYNITQAEIEERFLEKHTLDLINAHAGVRSDRLPPMEASTFEGSSVTWQFDDVKNNIGTILQAYVPVLRVENSLNAIPYTLPSSFPYSELVRTVTQALYDHMVLPIGSFQDYTVNFYYYTQWPLYFNINHVGGVISPESSLSDLIPEAIFPLHRYNAVYDVSAPTIVEVRDLQALSGAGFSLKFALESNIRNNKPLSAGTVLRPLLQSEGSLFCTERNSGNVSISVRGPDGPVKNAQLIFGSVDACQIGVTDTLGHYVGPLPVGIGILKVLHPEFVSKTQSLQTYLERDESVDVALEALENIQLKGRVATSTQSGNSWSKFTGYRDLKEGEELQLAFQLVESPGDSAQSAAGAVTTNGGQIRLAKGHYIVRVIYTSTDTVDYEPIEYCESVGDVVGTRRCIMQPEETLNLPVPSTAYELQWLFDGQDELTVTGAFIDVKNGAKNFRRDSEFVGRVPELVLTQQEVFLPS